MVASSHPSSKLSTVVIRLGGFDLIMSFSGAIGTIMGASGIKRSVVHHYAAVVVVNHCFTSIFSTNGLLSDIVLR